MREKRFFHGSLNDTIITLNGEESHHAVNVLRVKEGDMVTLFDGRGGLRRARVLCANRKGVTVEACGPAERVTRPRPSIRVGAAIPKGKRASTLVEECAALGVDELMFVHTERGQTVFRESALERLAKKSVEACKQSRRAYVMRVERMLPFDQALQELGSADEKNVENNDARGRDGSEVSSRLKLALHPDESASKLLSGVLNQPKEDASAPDEIALLIGPEGGFTEGEIGRAVEAGFLLVRLPTPILRIELAATAAVSMLRYAFPHAGMW